MYILGINLSHDRSACLLKDGKILFAIAEERLDGVKKSTLYFPVRKKGQNARIPPMRSISYCLNAADIGLDDVDLIVADNPVEPVNIESLKFLLPIKDKSKIKSLPHPSHHLAHAYSSYFCSPFSESAILVADVFGSYTSNGTEAESGFYAEGTIIEPILKTYQKLFSAKKPQVEAYYSLTYIYNFISLALGFSMGKYNPSMGEVVTEAGKTMGLAPYGKPVRDWPDIVEIINNKIGTSRFVQLALDNKIAKIRKGLLVPIVKPKHDKLNQFHKNLAHKAQEELEKGMIYLGNRLFEMTGSENLCIAGGGGLNSITNKKILDHSPFKHIFIQPAATDDGIAIGCALYGWHTLADGKNRFPLKNVYLGRKYPQEEIRASLRRHKILKRALTRNELICRTAQYIAAGKIVGWFQGGSEFGPRALGHRSILADPRRPEMKDLVTKKVKHRESFRPYAPSILLECTAEFFDLSCPSPFMLLVSKVKEDKGREIPAVIHVDGTARVQTVTRADNELYYELIKEFYQLTSVPVILNTSFNIRGMPIVETPDDAIELFFSTGMDVLVLGNYLFHKDGQEEMRGLVSYYEENKKKDKALAVSQKALKKFPDDGRFYLFLAKYHFGKKNYREAIKAAFKTLELNGREDDVNVHEIIGRSFENTNEFAKAIPELKKAERMSPEDEKINFSLYRCYKNTNHIRLMNQELEKGWQKLKRKRKGF
jgi:carbamoyltransferase